MIRIYKSWNWIWSRSTNSSKNKRSENLEPDLVDRNWICSIDIIQNVDWEL